MEAVLVTALLVFVRMGAMLTILPVFSSVGVPRYVPVLGAFSLAVIISPTVAVVPAPDNLAQLLFAVAGEVGLGAVLGGSVRMIFGAMGMAAEAMALQVGFGAFSLLNPLLQTREGPLGTMATWLAAMVFLSTGLHLRALEILASSFATVPPGQLAHFLAAAPILVELLALSFGLAMQLAAPTLALAWLMNVFVAILTKLAPRMNVYFSLGLTMGSAVGIFMVATALPWILHVHFEHVAGAVRTMLAIIGVVG